MHISEGVTYGAYGYTIWCRYLKNPSLGGDPPEPRGRGPTAGGEHRTIKLKRTGGKWRPTGGQMGGHLTPTWGVSGEGRDLNFGGVRFWSPLLRQVGKHVQSGFPDEGVI